MCNHSFRTSLRCLAHPTTLFGIALLLLNDHLFKVVAPSWITGKVSDLAGLFFFPFLLAVALSVLLNPFPGFTPTTIGCLAFAITALWFAVAKATPWGHSVTVQVVSAMLGHRVSVALDPSDLLGLVMLWPAWRLWCREANRPPRETPAYAGWAAFALATLATAATSYPPTEYVQRIVVVEGETYTLVERRHSRTEQEWVAYQTSDDGQSWSPIEPIPESVQEKTTQQARIVVGDPNDPRTQYRLAEERVEASEDGGHTWRIDWQIPPGRRKFMARHPQRRWRHPVDIGPYDLAFTPDESSTLVVAAGTEGVLVRAPSGAWSRHAVGTAQPTPYSTRDPDDVLTVLFFEGVFVLASTYLLSVALSIWGWSPILRAARRDQEAKQVAWALRPGLVLIVSIVLVLVVGWLLIRIGSVVLDIDRSFGRGFFNLVLLLPVLVAVVVLVIWSRTVRLANDEKSARRSRRGCVGTTLIQCLASSLPLVLWASGVIPEYDVAILGAFVLGLGVVVVGAAQVHSHSRKAAERRRREW